MIEKIKYPYVFTTKAKCASFIFITAFFLPACRERSPRSRPIWRSLRDTCHDLPPKEYLTPGPRDWVDPYWKEASHLSFWRHWILEFSSLLHDLSISAAPGTEFLSLMRAARNILLLLYRNTCIDWMVRGGPFNLWRDTSVKGEKRALSARRETLIWGSLGLWKTTPFCGSPAAAHRREREKTSKDTRRKIIILCVCVCVRALKHIHTPTLLPFYNEFLVIYDHTADTHSLGGRCARTSCKHTTSNFWRRGSSCL